MSSDLALQFATMVNAIGLMVWHLNLDPFEKYRELWCQLQEVLPSPHEALHALASHYQAMLKVSDQRHAPAIATLGEVFQLTGVMAQCYHPNGTAAIDKLMIH